MSVVVYYRDEYRNHKCIIVRIVYICSELVLREEERLAQGQRKEEAQRLLDQELWLQRERIAQEEFRKKREKEEQVLREREEREVLES